MENQINKEVNIDDIELDQYQYLKHKTDTAYYYGDSSGKRKVRSYASQQASFDYSTPNEFSQDYIDIMINHTKSVFDLSSDAVKEFILEDILVNRIRVQRQFNKLVSIGDKVYVIHFTYNGKDYSNYVICDADSKKVVYDNVFLGVKIPKED